MDGYLDQLSGKKYGTKYSLITDVLKLTENEERICDYIYTG